MTDSHIDQPQKKNHHNIKEDMKSNGDFIMVPKGLRKMGITGLHLEVYIKLLESESKYITQEQIASDLDCDVRTVKRAYKLFKTNGMMKGKKLLPRNLWIKKGDMSVTKKGHQCHLKGTSVSPTIKENKSTENFSETTPNDVPLDDPIKDKNIEIKNRQVSQLNTSDTSYDKLNNDYGKAVADHLSKEYVPNNEFKELANLVDSVHGYRGSSKTGKTVLASYKDWASDDNLADYVIDTLRYYFRVVEGKVQRPSSLNMRGKYIIFNERFREQFWKDLKDEGIYREPCNKE